MRVDNGKFNLCNDSRMNTEQFDHISSSHPGNPYLLIYRRRIPRVRYVDIATMRAAMLTGIQARVSGAGGSVSINGSTAGVGSSSTVGLSGATGISGKSSESHRLATVIG